MNKDIEKNQQQSYVTSVGNAWVVCDSKSRPGYKYYFNTFSGEAVWNLSPEEIEKAKSYTKGLPISEIEKCPEPVMDPPIDPNMNPSRAGASRIYHESFVRHNPAPNMFPMNLMHVNNMPTLSNIPGMNPLIWGNPSNNPALGMPPVVYVSIPSMNFQQPQVASQNLSTPFMEVPDNFNTFTNSRDNEMFNRSHRMHDMAGHTGLQRGMQQTNQQNSNVPDLRQKLMRKRSKSCSIEPAPLFEQEDDKMHQEYVHKNINIIDQGNTEECPSKYKLSVLEHLKKTPHTGNRNWIIVVDIEIILKNFSFLDKITDPEQDCYLVVPDHVMEELEELVSIGGDTKTRRILRFLSEQIKADLVFRGARLQNNVVDEDNTYKMIVTCNNLAERNNVILLSNDERYQQHRNELNDVYVLTFNELLQILNNSHVKQVPPRIKSPTLNVKIVVPNNAHRDKIVPTRERSKSPEFEIRRIPLTPKKKEPALTSKHKEPTITKPVSHSTKSTTEKSETIQTFNIAQTLTEKHSEIDQISKTSERMPKTPTKLSRHFNFKTSDEGSQKRQYRWRKSRNCTKTKSNSVSSDQANPSELTKRLQSVVESVPEISLQPMSPKQMATPNLLLTFSPISSSPRPISPMPPPSVDRSSITSHKDPSRPNITIEETSTSGVISNTTVDSDSVPTCPKLKKTVSVCEDVELEMFAVVGQNMEEVLRTRREEWVLRFVQIMEESLREALRRAPLRSRSPGGGWAGDLPELARGVIQHHSGRFSVVDAANRFAFKLQKISDSEGANIGPQQYMDLYSFGVYLIRSLKQVTEDCVEMATADESLKKLLYDIQNTNLEAGHSDTFVDEQNETVRKSTEPPRPEELLHEKESCGQINNNANNDVSMSPRKGSETQISKDSQPAQTNVEINFFSNLSLEKRQVADKPSLTPEIQNTRSTSNTSKTAQTPPQVSLSPKIPQASPFKSQTNEYQSSDDSSKNPLKSSCDPKLNTGSTEASPIEISFVRNFNCIPQFEEKLNKGRGTQDTVDAPVDEYFEDDYDADYHGYYEDNTEIYPDNELEEDEIGADDEHLLEADPDNENPTTREEGKENFEWFMKTFTDEIKQTIKDVLTYAKLGRELKSSPEASQGLRAASVSLSNIKNALDKILDDEPATQESNIIQMLRVANLHDYVPSKELLNKYINIISKCSDEVNKWNDKVTLLMQATGIQIA